MKYIKRFVIIEAIIFLAAGVIAFIRGDVTIEKYGKILLYCGFGSLAIGVAIDFGSKRGTMSDRWSSVRTSHQQELRDMKDLQSSGKSTFTFFLVSVIPVAVGYLLIYYF
jgi:hypothetical protein